MKPDLKDILTVLLNNDLVTEYDLKDEVGTKIASITYNSKMAGNGCLFVCKGSAFKEQYLKDALRNGACCYVSETIYDKNNPYIIVNDIRKAMPYIAERFYGIKDELIKIGITGTKGKTTCAYYIKKMLDTQLSYENAPCKECGFITTVETFDGIERVSTGITTPEAFELYRHFDNACKSGIDKIVMEISSQALKYRRTQGIFLDTALFLNISEDHISPNEHEDFEDYFTSKLKIFSQCKNAVICRDCDYFERILQSAKGSDTVQRIITYGFDPSADAYGFDIKEKGSQTEFKLKYNDRIYEFVLNMRGDFNVLNAIASACVGFIYGISYESMKKAFENVSVPGRGEEYHSPDDKLTAIVDYAHNGFSFEKIICMAKKSWPEALIVTLFGSPGGKAYNRRKDLGTAASLNSDFLYLTADDPGREDVNEICKEISKYAEQNGCKYVIISDREQAIFQAVADAAGRNIKTVLMILGKGCETAQKGASGNEAYRSDAVVVQDAINTYWSK